MTSKPRPSFEEWRKTHPPIAGGEPTLAEVQERSNTALEAFQTAATALADVPDDVTDEQLQTRQAAFDEAETEYKRSTAAVALRQRVEDARELAPIEPVQQVEETEETEPKTRTEAKVKKEPLTYEERSDRSFFRDAMRRALGDNGAAQRLDKHMQEMRKEGRDGNPDRLERDLNSTDATGGYLVAPIYLQDEFVELARAGRPTVNAIGTRPLPPKTDSINIPTMSTGTTTADQADNAAVSETDAAFGTVAADVKTIAGLQDVSQQVVDRSVPGVDQIIFADLSRDYNTRLDVAVLNSSTTNNKGLLQVSGTNSVTYTDASPTVPEIYPKLADSIQQIQTGIFTSPDLIVVHPRRWAWFLASLDTANRPLFTPYAPMNAAGLIERVGAENVVGNVQGIPVVVDSSVPSTNGAGTNEDAIIVLDDSQTFIWEDQGGPYLDTFRDVGSGTLTVRFRLFNYWAQCHSRRPKAISKITGTGLAAPTF